MLGNYLYIPHAMLQYNPNHTLFSIHIPKAGGSSFRNMLKIWFGDKLFLHYYDEKNNKMPPLYELRPGICIHGHFNARRNFGIQQYYPKATQFITILRDPFDILVSRYFYVKSREKIGISYRDGMLTSLPDDVNIYLRYETTNPNYTPNILDFFPESITYNNYRTIIEKYFIFIGFLDVYQNSVNYLADLLGFTKLPAPFENRSEHYHEVDPSLRKDFVEKHQLEYNVYNYAREYFLPIILSKT